jgi:hypothetical protein
MIFENDIMRFSYSERSAVTKVKAKVGYYVSEATLRKLRRLAALDYRTLSGEVEWLVEREWARRGATLGRGRQDRAAR